MIDTDLNYLKLFAMVNEKTSQDRGLSQKLVQLSSSEEIFF